MATDLIISGCISDQNGVYLNWKDPDAKNTYQYDIYGSWDDGRKKLLQSGLVIPTAVLPVDEYEFFLIKTLRRDGTINMSEPIHASQTSDKHRRLAEMIMKRERRYYEHHHGKLIATIYARINTGERCRRCWSAETGEATESNCPVCMGTGYNKGYVKTITNEPMLQVEINREPYDGAPPFNSVSRTTIALRSVSPQVIQERDILKIQSELWEAMVCNPLTTVAGITAVQQCSLALIPKDSIIYEVLK